jgi:hypothetical protein
VVCDRFDEYPVAFVELLRVDRRLNGGRGIPWVSIPPICSADDIAQAHGYVVSGQDSEGEVAAGALEKQ